MGQVAGQIRRAGAGGDHAHARKGFDHALLLAGKSRVDAQRLPVLDIHAGRVEGGQHARLPAAVGHLSQKLQAGLAQVVVAHPGDLHRGDRQHVFGVIDRAQGDQDLHGLAH